MPRLCFRAVSLLHFRAVPHLDSAPHFHHTAVSLALGISVAESSLPSALHLSIFWNRVLLANSLTLVTLQFVQTPSPSSQFIENHRRLRDQKITVRRSHGGADDYCRCQNRLLLLGYL